MWELLINRWLRVPYTLHIYAKRRPKKPKATVLFLHGIGNSGMAWQEVVDKLPPDIAIISIDLLGFGKSPKPKTAKYNATTQARSVIATLLRAGVTGRLIVVGHSLGALVAVEVAKRYPMLVKSLVLCSPPFYLGETNDISYKREQRLRRLYKLIQERPEQFVKISALAVKYKLVGKAFSVTTDDVATYMDTLESSILNQTAAYDAIDIKKPTVIIHGQFDSYVIKANLQYVAQRNKNIALKVVAAGHEVRILYVDAVVKQIMSLIK